MNLVSEDFQYEDSYFAMGNPWVFIGIAGVLLIVGVVVYRMLRKKR